MKLDDKERVKVREAAGAIAFGWNLVAQTGIVPGMRQYQEVSLTDTFERVLLQVAERMPEDI